MAPGSSPACAVPAAPHPHPDPLPDTNDARRHRPGRHPTRGDPARRLRHPLRLLGRAAALQPPALGHAAVPAGHAVAGPAGLAADAQRQLREDHPDAASLHRQLPDAQGRPRRPGQCAAHRRRGAAGHDLRQALPRHAAEDQRRGLPDAGRGPALHEVAVDGQHALGRGDGGGTGRQHRHGRQLRRLARSAGRGPRQCRALRRDRPDRRRRRALQHRLRAAAGRESQDRPGAGLRRAGPADRGAAREVRRRRRHAARDRFRQGHGRSHRGAAPGAGVLRRGAGDLRRRAVGLHPLRAQHRAGRGLLADCRGVAVRPAGAAGLCAGSVLGAGALPGLRDRHEPWRAEDERDHAGRGPRHAPRGRRALHLPPPLRRGPDRAAVRCRRLRRAGADQDPGHPGPGAGGEHRRGGADLHQPRAAAHPAVLRRREPGGRPAQPARRPRVQSRRGQLGPVAPARPLHATRPGADGAWRFGGAGRGGLCGQHAAARR